ncbi:TIGR04222 domain-containing membrane protein [Streptomyces tritici]|uniref:TIGR04222 domain-containing membrane protein n=1 Tax=Streptomyces tritici TaxID=2054410 RepID=UPI003AEF3237
MNLLAALLSLAVLASLVLLIVRLANSRRGTGGYLYELPEAAFVQGGPARVVDSVLAAMHADGVIGIGGPGIVVPLGPAPRHPVEQAVLAQLAAAPHGALHTLRLAVMRHPSVQEIGHRLAARGLLVAPADRRRTLRHAAVQGFGCFAMVFVSIFLSLGAADSAGMSIPFVVKVLPALGLGIVSALVCGAIAAGRVTGPGHRALLAYRQEHAYRTDPGFLVALRGLGALPDPMLQAQLLTAARMPRTTGDTGSSSPDGDDDAAAVWCAGISGGGGGCGGGGGGGGAACSSGSTCSSSSSSCSSSSSGSSCSSSSSSSSCGSSSSS